jgi:hypothetical protein
MKYLQEYEQALDAVIGDNVRRILEAENPNQVGGNQNSPIPGTPPDLMPQPDPREVRMSKKKADKMRRWLKHSNVLGEGQ